MTVVNNLVQAGLKVQWTQQKSSKQTNKTKKIGVNEDFQL